MELLTIQEQQDQAQHGIKLTPEQMQEQLDAIEAAWEDSMQEYIENGMK